MELEQDLEGSKLCYSPVVCGRWKRTGQESVLRRLVAVDNYYYVSDSELFPSFNDPECTRLKTGKIVPDILDWPSSISQGLVSLGAGANTGGQALLNMSNFTEHQWLWWIQTTQKHEHHPEYKNDPASPFSASEGSLFFTGYSSSLDSLIALPMVGLRCPLLENIQSQFLEFSPKLSSIKHSPNPIVGSSQHPLTKSPQVPCGVCLPRHNKQQTQLVQPPVCSWWALVRGHWQGAFVYCQSLKITLRRVFLTRRAWTLSEDCHLSFLGGRERGPAPHPLPLPTGNSGKLPREEYEVSQI